MHALEMSLQKSVNATQVSGNVMYERKKGNLERSMLIAEERSMMPDQLKQRRIVASASLDVVQISVRKIEQLFLKNSGE
jgi:hypothetical protein